MRHPCTCTHAPYSTPAPSLRPPPLAHAAPPTTSPPPRSAQLPPSSPLLVANTKYESAAWRVVTPQVFGARPARPRAAANGKVVVADAHTTPALNTVTAGRCGGPRSGEGHQILANG